MQRLSILVKFVIVVNRRRRQKTRKWKNCWTFWNVNLTLCCLSFVKH